MFTSSRLRWPHPSRERRRTLSAQTELALLPAQKGPAAALPPVLVLHLFGAMVATDAAKRSVLPRTRKTRAVLAVLARNAPRPVLRAQLIALLWSRREPDQARASLRQALHELQSALGPEPARLLRIRRQDLALDDRGLWTDVATLHAAEAPDALDLFAPPLLGDLIGLDPAFDAWTNEEYRHLAAGLHRRIATWLDQGDRDAALPRTAERLVARDPADASGWDLLIRALASAGEPTETAIARREAALGPKAPALALPPPPPAPPRGHAVWIGAATGRGPRVGVIGLRALPGAEPGARALAAGLSDELTAALARFRGIACIPLGLQDYRAPWTAAGASPGLFHGALHEKQSPDQGLAARIDFLLDGTVQTNGDQIRVRVRLLDVAGGGDVVWSARFDRVLENIFTLQDELAGETVARLESHLLLWQERRARPPPHPGAQRLLREALPGLLRLDRAAFQEAGALLAAANDLDPDNGSVHAWLAHWHLFAVGQGWADAPDEAGRAVRVHVEAAVALDPTDARALGLAAHVRGFVDHDPKGAERLHARAMDANPNLPLGWSFAALNEAYLGRYGEAARRAAHAARLSPHDPLRYFFDVALAVPLFLRGDDGDSIRIGREAIAANPGFSSAYKTQLAALGQLGRREEAADIRARLLALEPGFSVAEALERSPIQDPEGRARYAEGLRRGGLE